jgi:hypothetical protein
LQTLWVASNDAAEEIVHPLENDRMIAGEISESQVRPFAAHGVEEHRAPEGSIWSRVLIVDGEEGREAVGGIFL